MPRARPFLHRRDQSPTRPSASSPSTNDAVASSEGPFTVPRTLQTATRTCGRFRIRLTFHDSASVYAYNASLCSTNQTGVCTPWPFFLKVSSEMYFALRNDSSVRSAMPSSGLGRTHGKDTDTPREREALSPTDVEGYGVPCTSTTGNY